MRTNELSGDHCGSYTDTRIGASTGTARDTATTYAVRDNAGVVVDLSHWEIEPESPATHARDFLAWLIEQDAAAGLHVLEKVSRKTYTTEFCPRFDLRPMPWPSVLRRFSELINGPRPVSQSIKVADVGVSALIASRCPSRWLRTQACHRSSSRCRARLPARDSPPFRCRGSRGRGRAP